MSEKKNFLRYLWRKEYQPGILNFSDVLSDVAINALGKDTITVNGFVQSAVTRFWSVLLKQQAEDSRNGLSPYFKVEDLLTKRISYVNDDYRLKSRPAIYRAIDSLSDRQYEMLACFVCDLMGASPTNIKLTPPGNEGGIDFIATINFPAKSHYFIGIKGPIRIIGQCKKYGTSLEVGEIKSFITTLNQVKDRSPSVEDHVPPWFRISQGPIIGWVISHNGFQSGAHSLSKDYGIVLSDTREIGEFISMSKKYHPYKSPLERAKLLHADIKAIELNSLYA